MCGLWGGIVRTESERVDIAHEKAENGRERLIQIPVHVCTAVESNQGEAAL